MLTVRSDRCSDLLGATLGTAHPCRTRLHALKFNLILSFASCQHQTTHCFPDYRCKTKCERAPNPFLPPPIASIFPHSHLSLFALGHRQPTTTRQSAYNACIYTYPPARRRGHGVLIRNLCTLHHFSCVSSSPWNRCPHRLCRPFTLHLRLPHSPLPLVSLSVQDDISTLAALLLSTTPSFTNVRLCRESVTEQVADRDYAKTKRTVCGERWVSPSHVSNQSRDPNYSTGFLWFFWMGFSRIDRSTRTVLFRSHGVSALSAFGDHHLFKPRY
ncbi:hypothetical protein BGY98DRAFT_434509 [Russula aff. rugulosa BPL654]|nr:hypothetical protein BGY98DRAFT_434509 [Russula aff. rugulosa BPL654]